MPAVHIKTNVAYTEEQKTKVLKEITRVMVDVAHKNEEAVMATLLKVDGTMGNTDEPFAFLDIRSMNGIEHKMNNDVCVEMTKIMEDVLGVNPLRQYLVFTRVPETCWGLMAASPSGIPRPACGLSTARSASKHPSSGARGRG